MYGNWQRVCHGDIDIKGVAMIDPSQIESAAMKQCLKFFGEAAGEIGFAKPLGDYSEAQALQAAASGCDSRIWSMRKPRLRRKPICR